MILKITDRSCTCDNGQPYDCSLTRPSGAYSVSCGSGNDETLQVMSGACGSRIQAGYGSMHRVVLLSVDAARGH